MAPMPRTMTYVPAFSCSRFSSSARPSAAWARAVAATYDSAMIAAPSTLTSPSLVTYSSAAIITITLGCEM
eukprot:192950-Prymnesium_polylepis.1